MGLKCIIVVIHDNRQRFQLSGGHYLMRSIKPIGQKRRQRGFTLLEVLMSVGLGSLIMVSGAKFMNDRVDDVKDQTTAQYQTAFAQASDRYLRNNFTAVAGGLAQNGPPVAISLNTIRAAGFAHSGLVNSNPYRQTPCLIVRRLTDNSAGARLEALVTTEGGLAIPDRRIPFVAAQSGAIGGFVPPTAPTTAQGAYGVWQTSINPFTTVSCSGTPVSANRLASGLFFDVSTIAGGVNADDVLHRVVVAGRPDLNRMNTNLDMGGYSISAANNITATGTVQGSTVLATGPGGYAQTYLQQWGLAGNGTIYIEPSAGSRLYLTDSWAKTGVLDVQFGGISNTGYIENMSGRVHVSRTGTGPCCGDSGTLGLGENTVGTGREAGISFHNGGYDEGNFVLANKTARGGSRRFLAYDNQGQRMGIQATGDISTYGGSFVTSNALYADIFYDYYNNGYYVRPRSTSRMDYVVTNNSYAYGWKSADIYYDSGNWGYYTRPRDWSYMYAINMQNAYIRDKGRYLADLLPNWVHKGTHYMAHGWGLGKPGCPNGGSPRVLVIPKRLDAPMEAYFGAGQHQGTSDRVIAYDYGSWWGFEIGTYYYWGNGGVGFWGGSGLASTYCWYP
jgi:prepilin-type N-terminal cleavage/methylation domain-containing protein